MTAAPTELAQARARIAELEKALEPFARACKYDVLDIEHDLDPIHKMGRASRTIEVGDLRRARAALAVEKREGGE